VAIVGAVAVEDAVREPFSGPSAWKGAARGLLERAIARHGGWEAWRAVERVALAPTALTGLLPWLKGVGRTFKLPARVDVWPHARRAVFYDYPNAGGRGEFDDGRVRLLDGAGAVIASDDRPRASFRGWRRYRRWSPADALYFFGYALTHYHALPFSLVDARPLRLCAVRFEGRRLDGVDVELPADLHTHSRRQSFYFEADGLLRRHDYVADIVGGWARGAHFWSDFARAGGIEIAQRRHVVARLGRWAVPVVALHAELAVQ
jgi:hypothetical protein